MLYEDGLYQRIDLTTPEGEVIERIIRQNLWFTHDLFCPTCDMVTTYELRTASLAEPETKNRYSIKTKPGLIALHAACLRQYHLITFIVHLTDTLLMKVGQIPSTADLAQGELKTIRRGLADTDRVEMSRALGLFAHDTHIGAFVYLRRVFERMIRRAHERHVEVGLPAVPDFETSRMEDRIQAVRDQLPSGVVANRRVFSVLSKTIHELSEQEAGAMFPVMKRVIFQMLGEEERLREAKRQEDETNAAFQAILSDMSGNEEGAPPE